MTAKSTGKGKSKDTSTTTSTATAPAGLAQQNAVGNAALAASLPKAADEGSALLADDTAVTQVEKDTVAWLAKSYGVTEGSVPELEAKAREALAGVPKAQIKAYKAAGLTDADLVALSFYTTNAAYAINAVLRGLITTSAWQRAYRPWAERAAAALTKMPPGAMNQQGDQRIDPSQGAKKTILFDTVYRYDSLGRAAFANLFKGQYKVGATLAEPAFLSTTLIKGSYGGGEGGGVSRTITDAGQAKNISALSAYPAENEALLPPGSTMQITAITDAKGKSVADPGKVKSAEALAKGSYEVTAKLVSVGGSPGQGAADTAGKGGKGGTSAAPQPASAGKDAVAKGAKAASKAP